jgi:hypothetical protein
LQALFLIEWYCTPFFDVRGKDDDVSPFGLSLTGRRGALAGTPRVANIG